MPVDLQSIVISKSPSGLWEALHVPSGKKTLGTSPEDAQLQMQKDFGLDVDGKFEAPLTSHQFEGLAQAIAAFLEGPVSEALALHTGYARLVSFDLGVASIHLGGGCKGCPSSQITLFQGVKSQLQDRFGEQVILDVQLV